jgi:hypothetical protein
MSVAGWATQYGGPASDGGNSVAVDSAGNLYAAGGFQGTAVFKGNGAPDITLTSIGGSDLAVVKYNPDGTLAWARQMGGSSGPVGGVVQVDSSGNVYVAGFFSNTAYFGSTPLTSKGYEDVFVTKLDTSGNFDWAERMGGTYFDAATCLALDSQNNLLYLTGEFSRTADFGSNINLTSTGATFSAFAAKLDTGTGNVVWAEQMGGVKGVGNAVGHNIALDGAGGVDEIGYYNGGPAQFGNSVSLPAPNPSPYNNVFVTKLNASGQFLWAQQLGSGATDTGLGLASTSSAVYVTGTFQGTALFGKTKLTSSTNPNGVTNYDAFVTSLSTATGAVSWAKAFGDSTLFYGRANSVAVDSGGTLSVAGSFSSSVTFLERMDASGNILATWQASATAVPYGAGGVGVDSGGVLYLTGEFQNTVTFDTGGVSVTLTSAGGYDAFVLKRDPQAVPAIVHAVAASRTAANAAPIIMTSAPDPIFVAQVLDDPLFLNTLITGKRRRTI